MFRKMCRDAGAAKLRTVQGVKKPKRIQTGLDKGHACKVFMLHRANINSKGSALPRKIEVFPNAQLSPPGFRGRINRLQTDKRPQAFLLLYVVGQLALKIRMDMERLVGLAGGLCNLGTG